MWRHVLPKLSAQLAHWESVPLHLAKYATIHWPVRCAHVPSVIRIPAAPALLMWRGTHVQKMGMNASLLDLPSAILQGRHPYVPCPNGDGDCTTLDPNSVCDATTTKCACKATYGISPGGISGDCQPGVGATCTASGSECQYLLGGYCETTVCACADIMQAIGTMCETKSCTADTTCTTLDANSECMKDICVCKSGYALDGTSKSCVATGSSNAITASIAVMLMSLLVSVLQH
ncbi:uncharacterized protein LOC128230774 [Mya arenaria]|uniref:uncharacterized protein LOC128230774 n=1 Tax=Mya arenaria TaxID=6604 RepID=UPI0022E9925B|nr:uncharacterized protein LOC128230774 [Mya arenaria]